MPEQRRRFSPQFKAEAVQMVIETGKPIAEVARGLGIHDGTLGNWVNAYRRAHPEPDQPLSPVERVRVTELEDEVRRLRLENEFQRRPDRSLLEQRRRRIVLRRPEERVLPPETLPHPRPRPVHRRRLHRSLLQPPAPALHPRLPHPRRSPHRPPPPRRGLTTTTRGTVQEP